MVDILGPNEMKRNSWALKFRNETLSLCGQTLRKLWHIVDCRGNRHRALGHYKEDKVVARAEIFQMGREFLGGWSSNFKIRYPRKHAWKIRDPCENSIKSVKPIIMPPVDFTLKYFFWKWDLYYLKYWTDRNERLRRPFGKMLMFVTKLTYNPAWLISFFRKYTAIL